MKYCGDDCLVRRICDPEPTLSIWVRAERGGLQRAWKNCKDWHHMVMFLGTFGADWVTVYLMERFHNHTAAMKDNKWSDGWIAVSIRSYLYNGVAFSHHKLVREAVPVVDLSVVKEYYRVSLQ